MKLGAACACVLLAVGSCTKPHRAARGPEIVVSASLPGASAVVMAQTVAVPLERQLGRLAHVAAVTSVSTAGTTRVTITLDHDAEVLAAEQAVQHALESAASQLPATLPAPPVYRARGSLVARYVTAEPALAELAVPKLAMTAGVGMVDECGGHRPQTWIEVDPLALAAAGVTLTDVVTAVRTAGAGDRDAELALVIALFRDGAPIHVGDLAKVLDDEEADCSARDARGLAIEIAVYAKPRAVERDVIGRLATATTLTPLPAMRALHVGLRAGERAPLHATEVREVLIHTPGIGELVVEATDVRVRVLVAGSDAVVATATAQLRALPFVASAGEPTSTVRIQGADPAAVIRAGRALADRLARDHALVATRGLDESAVVTVDVDRDAAARLGVVGGDIDDTLAATRGVLAASSFTPARRIYVRSAYADDPALVSKLRVRASTGTLVPLSTFVAVKTTREPLEVLHDGQFRAVAIEANTDEATLRRAVEALALPADLHVAIEPASDL